ncbi:MAG: preprotein translocase subunit SecA [Labilithrix sp.]|nr:preprotein translocase subunit SecA [Labilithrix sp.]MCW5810373.1 preprotein translocase subunit SecA [Labilithrix sp.]
MLTWALKKILGTSHEREIKKLQPFVVEINKLDEKMAALKDSELKAITPKLKEKLDNGATLDDILVEAFAALREAGKRSLRMRHYDVQLIGGMVLHKGMISEMRTGEGKTLVATLACYLNALEGKGVHVVTVNDYLARRDAEWMGKLYGYMGLSTGVVVNQQRDKEKKDAYKSDITYGQNNEFGFDYLRDNMKFSALDYVQRELNYAIVDEVDSILIDEARTPLIISGQAEASSQKYRTINEVIPRLKKDEHYVVDEKGHSVSLTDDGIEAAQKLMGISNLYDPVNLESLHILNQCLRAHTLYKRDVNYLVTDDGKVLIIDEFTGRVLPGRRWSDGLHQAVEAKEHVNVQEETRTMATITFQNLFRIYKKLGGMTGTADTEAEEFHKTYKLNVVTIPTNKVIQRVDKEDLVYKTEREKFTAVTNEILQAHEKGRPVLVGTTSVEKSNAIAKILKKKGIPHAVLNAKQHEKEAFVVAQAGRKGAITVSTNMAGRGTDIILGGNAEMLAKLEFKEQGRDESEVEEFDKTVKKYEASCKKEGDEVREAGGLHIVGTERHESRRIDNQLRGRAGRQGDPGSSIFYLSLEDDLMRIFAGDRVKGLMEKMGMPDDEPIEHPWVTKSIQDAQRKVEGRNFDIRKNLLEYDDVMNEQRKTVYKIRQQLLLGIYIPEVTDDEGKPTGKIRKIDTLERLVDDVKGAITEMVLHYGTPMPEPGEEVKRPKKVEDTTEIFDMDGLRHDVYQMWGYRFDYRAKEAKDAPQVYERLLEEIPSSLTQQRERLLDLVDQIVSAVVEESCPQNKPPEDWDWKGIKNAFVEHFGAKPPADFEHTHDLSDLAHMLYQAALELLEAKEKEMGTELLLRVFRHFYLEDIDKQWVEHLTNMEHLRDGISLRGYGQRDPKQEYKKEGYDIFVSMMASTTSNVVTKLMSVKLQKETDIERIEREDAARHQRQAQQMQLRHGGEVEGGGDEGAPPGASQPPPRPRVATPVKRAEPKISRNDLCPCGSGEKFKKCHGAALEDDDGGSDDATA